MTIITTARIKMLKTNNNNSNISNINNSKNKNNKKSFNDRNNDDSDNRYISNNNNNNNSNRQNSMERKKTWLKQEIDQVTNKNFFYQISEVLYGNVKSTYQRNKLKAVRNIASFMDHYPRNGYIGDNDHPLWYVTLTKVMKIT